MPRAASPDVPAEPTVRGEPRLRYEHLVELNDARAGVAPLTRAEVWAGILGRVRTPDLYDEAVDHCEIGQAEPLCRRYRRHGAWIEDEVALVEGFSARLTMRLPTAYAGSVLVISIDEPAPGALFLRFVYELRGEGPVLEAHEQQALRDAYRHADVAFVRRLRALTPPPGTAA